MSHDAKYAPEEAAKARSMLNPHGYGSGLRDASSTVACAPIANTEPAAALDEIGSHFDNIDLRLQEANARLGGLIDRLLDRDTPELKGHGLNPTGQRRMTIPLIYRAAYEAKLQLLDLETKIDNLRSILL